ncbi:pyridoxine kinase [Salinibacillus kushneri]|uniref:pyridoxal kinase n=1 Tax=Salinibacillus kushneri TaxID=237682 RepID=A0A1I0ASM7_9BACI|nr:bifunctional hydroxymethylpyrimidine kinase/phosphomethylpyrimidine kinase [Salinibacillus kushneri]SES97357.1 pyridoxine kinase [Salinibacillus kushneri]
MTLPKALTIAGSDSSGGAGIQADLKTFQEHGIYGMSALTVVVAMNPHNNWSHDTYPIDADTVRAQLSTILEGIGVDVMKTGMLPTVEIIETAAKAIKDYNLNQAVIDPVMVCKGADEVIYPELAEALRDVLTPVAKIVTPNLWEAGQLSGMGALTTIEQMKEAAVKIHELGAQNVLIKGGNKLDHENAVDVFFDGNKYDILESERIDTPYTHGAGCTYSAAITAQLAKGVDVKDAVYEAKRFITSAIRNSFKLNQYVGPVNHGAQRFYGE